MSINHDVIILQSKDRSLALGAYPSSNFKIQLPVKYSKVLQIQLLGVELPFTFYNVANSYLTGITFVGPILGTATAENFTLASGNYSIDDLCDALFAFLQVFTYSNSGVTTPYVTSVDYDHNNIIHINSKYALYSYNTGNGNLALIAGLNPALTGLPASSSTPASPTMGTTNTNNVLNADSTYTHYLNVPANLNLCTEVLLKFGNIASNVYTSSNTQATFRIQVDSPYGSMIYVNTATNVGNVINTPNGLALSYLDVSLIDGDNNLINLNNAEWTFSIGISYV